VSAPGSVVIVGGGMAGANAAFTLRKLGYEGRVTIASAERELPYERPPLSKDYLRGETPLDKAYVRPAADYEAEGVELLRGRTAAAIDVRTRRVSLDDGSSIEYGALVLATGSEPRHAELPAIDPSAVHYLRTVADADRIKSAAKKAKSATIIGGGWIGTEVAASLRQLGLEVTLVSRTARPLERVLGPEIAAVYRQLHEEHGVRFVQGSAGETPVDGELVVVGVGATPRLELARQAGLRVRGGGVVVDEYLKTSAPDVYAIGDIANAWHPRLRRHVRVEHWDNAKRQGRAVAATILGQGEPYVRAPYFYSDQFDLGMEYRGFAPKWDEVVVRGDLAAREFDAFWLAKSRVIAAMNANRWDDAKELAALVDAGASVDPKRLADPSISLAEAA
jgi:3-phenylpropionate/trans-cinnamate dioxygenase ferredoxin reductase component